MSIALFILIIIILVVFLSVMPKKKPKDPWAFLDEPRNKIPKRKR